MNMQLTISYALPKDGLDVVATKGSLIIEIFDIFTSQLLERFKKDVDETFFSGEMKGSDASALCKNSHLPHKYIYRPITTLPKFLRDF